MRRCSYVSKQVSQKRKLKVSKEALEEKNIENMNYGRSGRFCYLNKVVISGNERNFSQEYQPQETMIGGPRIYNNIESKIKAVKISMEKTRNLKVVPLEEVLVQTGKPVKDCGISEVA